MKKGKLLLTLIVIFNLFFVTECYDIWVVPVYANEGRNYKILSQESLSKEIDLTEDDMLVDVKVSKDNIQPEELKKYKFNQIDHTRFEDSKSFNDMNEECKVGDLEVTRSADNTDPNYAFTVSNNVIVDGTVENDDELYWYTFNSAIDSRVSVFLNMGDNLDADLYVFRLDENTSSLELIGGSATTGTGSFEFYNDVINSGIYFIAICGYDSTGDYSFVFYQSFQDVVYEINDNAATATEISFGNITGVIDSPFDYDYYKITLSNPAVIKYGINSSDGYLLQYAGCIGENAALYNIDNTNGFIQAEPGTYYFAVYSSDSTVYSATNTYTVNFKKIGNLSGVSNTYIYGISESAGIVYEANSDASVNYVNGNVVDISYSYINNIGGNAGGQYYYITIDANAGAKPVFINGYEPAAVHYFSSTKPAMNVSSRPALLMTYYCDNVFYRINCWGTGAYSMNTYRNDFNIVTVLIDPDTGNLIDIVEFNYYYDFAPVGNNYINWARSYTMTNYYN